MLTNLKLCIIIPKGDFFYCMWLNDCILGRSALSLDPKFTQRIVLLKSAQAYLIFSLSLKEPAIDVSVLISDLLL